MKAHERLRRAAAGKEERASSAELCALTELVEAACELVDHKKAVWLKGLSLPVDRLRAAVQTWRAL